MLAGLGLRRRGVDVEIVDTGVWPCQHSYALALHAASLDLLESYGLGEAARAGSYTVQGLALCDREGEKLATTVRGITVTRQDALEALLEKALKDAGVEIRWRHEVFSLEPGEDGVQATVNRMGKESRGYAVAHTEWVVEEQRKLKVPFVVGADGYNSQVRRTMAIKFPETAPADYYAVFEFETDADLGHGIRLVLGHNTTDVLWPLPGGAARWSFQLPGHVDPHAEEMKNRLLDAGLGYFPTERTKDRTAGDPGDALPELDEGHLSKLLEERAPWFVGKVGKVSWKTLVRFEKRQAESFGKGRMWLAGDAAHLAGPAAILSMNSGLQEAADLGGRIGSILRDGADVAVLSEYDRHWSGVWARIRGLRSTPGAPAFVQRHAAQIAECLPATGADLAELAGKLGFEF
jgi:2-polyprenyl-6-methoxyphenol hydroxylase-like FAD-dependent oxidoreductase